MCQYAVIMAWLTTRSTCPRALSTIDTIRLNRSFAVSAGALSICRAGTTVPVCETATVRAPGDCATDRSRRRERDFLTGAAGGGASGGVGDGDREQKHVRAQLADDA